MLNINGLNPQFKRHKDTHWIRRQDLSVSCLQESHLTIKDSYCFRVKGWRNIFQTTGNRKQAGITIVISDKMDIKQKLIRRYKKVYLIS